MFYYPFTSTYEPWSFMEIGLHVFDKSVRQTHTETDATALYILMRIQIRTLRGTCLRGGACASPLQRSYVWLHCTLFACRRWQMFLPSIRGGRMHSPPWGVTRLRCDLLPNYLRFLLFIYMHYANIAAQKWRRFKKYFSISLLHFFYKNYG